jgi:hypothetical protein
LNDEELAATLDHALTQGGFERDDLYLFDMPNAWMMTHEAHVREAERKAVLDSLGAHEELRQLFGTAINLGNRDVSVTPESLCSWILTRAKHVGATECVRGVRQFLSQPYTPVDEILAVSGLVLDKPIALSTRIELVPFAALNENLTTITLSDPKWEYFGRTAGGGVRKRERTILASFGRAHIQSDPSLPSAALRIRHQASPKTRPAAFTDTRESDLGLLLAVVNVLAAAVCTPVFPVAYWWNADPIVPCGDSGMNWGSWSHSKRLRPIAYAEEHDAILVATTGSYLASDDVHRQRMKVPLERFSVSLAADTPEDKAIDMGIALEALLLSDLGATDQQSLMFRLRGAWLLASSAEERQMLFREFRALYDCRSTAVHTGRLPEFVNVNGKIPATEFLADRGQRLAARAILEVLKTGSLPDWTTVICGG